jgi:Cu/Ag efflux protein CusF
MSSEEEMSATVKAIDYKTRRITLTDNGVDTSFVASDDVKNFGQIKKGDTVVIDYKEAVAWELNKGGKAAGPSETTTQWGARPGEKPEGGMNREVRGTVVITKIDKKQPSVTVKTAGGETQTLKVRHPERLEGVKVGDAVDVIYSEAMAVRVEKKSKM